MFLNFDEPVKSGITDTFGGVIGDIKWLIILLIAMPIALWLIRFLIDFLSDLVKKKKIERDIKLLNIGFGRYLKKKEYTAETFKELPMTKKRKLFKEYTETIEKKEKIDDKMNLPGYMTKTAFKRLRKLNLKKKIKE